MPIKPINGGPHLTWVNIIATLALLATVSGGAWILFQSQFTNLEQQYRLGLVDLSTQIKDNRADIDRLRSEVVLRPEHTEFTKRLDTELLTTLKRLDILEATRPTTGELEKTAGFAREQLVEIKERIRYLEQTHVVSH